MEQFFLRAVKAQLPVRANTDLKVDRPALAAESLSLYLIDGILPFLTRPGQRGIKD